MLSSSAADPHHFSVDRKPDPFNLCYEVKLSVADPDPAVLLYL
jgi:hypothetical protein